MSNFKENKSNRVL